MKKILALSAGAVAGGLLLVTAAFAVGTNGSFEDGTNPPAGTFRTIGGGSPQGQDINGWTVGGHSIDWIRTYWTASEGLRSIDLNGTSTGSISQELATSVGATYTVQFDLSGNPAGDPSVKTLQVSASGAASEGFSFDVTAAGNTLTDMKWEPQQYTFLATSSSTTLTFASTISGAFGPAIDNVVITETLPTADNCKKGGWASMIDSEGNTFKNQGDCVSFFATGGKNLGAGE